MHIETIWSFVLLFFALCNGKISFDSRFDDYYPFSKDISGPTGHAWIAPTIREGADGTNMMCTNATYVNNNGTTVFTYRAELNVDQLYRNNIKSSNFGVAWWGLSVYIPEDWVFTGSRDPHEIMFYAQQHGGDNLGTFPTWGIRYNSKGYYGSYLEFAVAGALYNETNRTAEVEDIKYFYLGKDQIGSWIDFVIRIDQQCTYTGSVKVWRNNVLMVDEKKLLTTYNDTNKHYFKFGSYNLNWKAGKATSNSWIAQYYSRVVYCEDIGEDVCTYDQLYTGFGEPCGDYCKRRSNQYVAPIYKNIYFVCFVPLGVIMFVVAIFMCTKLVMGKQFANKARKNQRAGSIAWGPKDHTRLTAAEKIRMVRQNSGGAGAVGGVRDSVISAVYAFRDTLIWAEEEEFVQSSQLWENPWQSSLSRRLFWYFFGYSFVFGMFVFAVTLYGNPLTPEKDGLLPWKKIHQWKAIDAMTFMVVSFVMTSIYFLPLLFIPLEIEKGKVWKNDPKFLKRIGVVIPCHKSAQEIGAVVAQIIKYIPPGNIVICDNGNFDWPKDNTFEVVKAVHSDIVYTFTSQGHKTRALWTGCHRLPRHCEYIMHIDDDTMISDNFVFDESHFTTEGAENVVAVAFLRQAHRMNRCTNFIDFWYKITDHFHATQAYITTRCFVPGPAGIWKREKFETIFAHHPALPFGEDIFGGFTILNHGYAIRSERRCIVTTFAPTVLVNCGLSVGRVQGYGAASIWKQRAHRWTVSALRITGKSLYSFFTYKAVGGLLPNIAFRLYRFREYKIIFVQILYIPFCLVILARGFYMEFLVLKFGLFIFPLLRNLFINYIAWRGQPELQVKFETVLLSPLYNFFLIMCAVHGRLKCLLWYLPEVPPNHGMLQETKPRDIQTIRVMVPPSFERELEIMLEADMKKKAMSPRDTDQSIGYDMYGAAGVDESPDTFHNPSFQPSSGGTHFRGKIEAKGSGSFNQSDTSANRRSTALKSFNRNDYFEYFFRDGASVFISYKAGGIRLENPQPGAMPMPLSLKDINPITGSEPATINKATLIRRRSSVEAVQGILKQSSTVSNEGQVKPRVSFGEESGAQRKGTRRKFSLQFDGVAEGNDDDDTSVEMTGKTGSRNPLHAEENDLGDLEMMGKSRTLTHSIYDVTEVEGDLMELSREEKHALRWVDIIRMSEMVYDYNDEYYSHQQEILMAAEDEEEVQGHQHGEGFIEVAIDDNDV